MALGGPRPVTDLMAALEASVRAAKEARLRHERTCPACKQPAVIGEDLRCDQCRADQR